jgi:glycosyltransferase involved in cell wall biosynthesis
MPFEMNPPSEHLTGCIGVIGQGKACLDGIGVEQRIIAGPAVVTHPAEWPDLCERYRVVRYLQPSEWANNIFKPYFGDRCRIWPVGIDTDAWRTVRAAHKTVDFLIYDKIMWNYDQRSTELLDPIVARLRQRGLSFEMIHYGQYAPIQYRSSLQRCRAMIFLCEHESQGIAYQECLSAGVPIIAWDQGWWLDPNRFAWGDPEIPATSVPYWDERCGVKFQNVDGFDDKLEEFLTKSDAGLFAPRQYILDNLTLETCARHYVEIHDEVAGTIR